MQQRAAHHKAGGKKKLALFGMEKSSKTETYWKGERRKGYKNASKTTFSYGGHFLDKRKNQNRERVWGAPGPGAKKGGNASLIYQVYQIERT